MIADHRDQIVQHHHLAHPLHFERRGLVHTRHLAAHHGVAINVAILRPGMRTSMPYCALPLTLSGVSSRLTDLPISLKSLSALSLGFCGAGNFAAADASTP